jgi:ribosomal protein S18 acetylase RimI-like enzyme
VIDVRELTPEQVDLVGTQLPLNRLPQHLREASTYLIAWDGAAAVGHAHIAWSGTHLGLPEIQDVFVLPDRRRRGIASALTESAEQRARSAGWSEISLSVGDRNAAARGLYEKLGYVDAAVEPVHVSGVVDLRRGPIEVDDTLVYLTKPLGPRKGV